MTKLMLLSLDRQLCRPTFYKLGQAEKRSSKMVKQNGQAMNAKTIPKNDVEFLKACLKDKQRIYQSAEHIDKSDLVFVPEVTLPTTDKNAERLARLADDNGFDGNLFRSLTSSLSDEPLSVQWWKHFDKQIKIIPKLIAAIEKPVDRSEIPDGAELLTIPQVARKLQCAESMVRQRDKNGQLPIPIRIGGVIQWNKKELEDWIAAGCPPRQKWEQIKKVGGGD